MKFMQRRKGTKSRSKRKRESKGKIIPGFEHLAKKQETGVVVDEAMVINKTPGRRSFNNFNSCLEKSLKLGRDYNKETDSKKEDIEKKPEVEGNPSDTSTKSQSSS